jgi:hypothetical protein
MSHFFTPLEIPNETIENHSVIDDNSPCTNTNSGNGHYTNSGNGLYTNSGDNGDNGINHNTSNNDMENDSDGNFIVDLDGMTGIEFNHQIRSKMIENIDLNTVNINTIIYYNLNPNLKPANIQELLDFSMNFLDLDKNDQIEILIFWRLLPKIELKKVLKSDLFNQILLKSEKNVQLILLLIESLSNLITRKFAIEKIKKVNFNSENEDFQFYLNFQIDQEGNSLDYKEFVNMKYLQIKELQKRAFTKFNKFSFYPIDLILKGNFKNELMKMDLQDLTEFAKLLEISPLERESLIKVINSNLTIKRDQLTVINSESLYINEKDAFDDALGIELNPNDICSFYLPRLGLQYLSLHDYLMRNFRLYKYEQAHQIRMDIMDALQRLDPCYNSEYSGNHDMTVFKGWSRMCTPILQFQISSIGPSRLTETLPQYVKADISYSLERYRNDIKSEWDGLRPKDTLYLITVEKKPEIVASAIDKNDYNLTPQQFAKKYGIKCIRGCEIFEILDDEQETVFSFNTAIQESKISGPDRFIRVLLDTNDYYNDTLEQEYSVYGTFNLLLRRDSSKNNHKSVLETIRDLMQSELVVPDWLHSLLLGYGNKRAAHYTNMNENMVHFGYTFTNWSHLLESFKVTYD